MALTLVLGPANSAKAGVVLGAYADAARRGALLVVPTVIDARHYMRELDRLGRADRERYAWRALDALRVAPYRWGAEPVFFYGFDDLTALERDAVETLARVVGVEVTVSLTYEPGREALVARAQTT